MVSNYRVSQNRCNSLILLQDEILPWFEKNKKKGEKKKRKKKKNGSYHFEFSTQNEKLVVHASALHRTSVCDKLTKKKKYINKYPIGTLPAGHKNCCF